MLEEKKEESDIGIKGIGASYLSDTGGLIHLLHSLSGRSTRSYGIWGQLLRLLLGGLGGQALDDGLSLILKLDLWELT